MFRKKYVLILLEIHIIIKSSVGQSGFLHDTLFTDVRTLLVFSSVSHRKSKNKLYFFYLPASLLSAPWITLHGWFFLLLSTHPSSTLLNRIKYSPVSTFLFFDFFFLMASIRLLSIFSLSCIPIPNTVVTWLSVILTQ